LSFIFTADWHLTERPRDLYRWSVVDQLVSFLELHSSRTRAVVLAGDLTHFKDGHSAALVGSVVQAFRRLASLAEVCFIVGNHDYAERRSVFFSFLEHLNTKHPISVHVGPGVVEVGGCLCWVLPHSDALAEDVARLRNKEPSPTYVFAHQCFTGAKAGGVRLQGEDPSILDAESVGGATVLAGDIHRPQRVGNVYYVGSPHPVAYGEEHEPQALVCTPDSLVSYKLASVRKRVLRLREVSGFDAAAQKAGLRAGDHAKVIVRQPRASAVEWPSIREELQRQCVGLGLAEWSVVLEQELEAVDGSKAEGIETLNPRQVLKQYCSQKKVEERLAWYGERMLVVGST